MQRMLSFIVLWPPGPPLVYVYLRARNASPALAGAWIYINAQNLGGPKLVPTLVPRSRRPENGRASGVFNHYRQSSALF